jgi:hypothetical protein
MRSYVQWLEMISRTRPSEFAVNALQVQLEKERSNLEPSEFEKLLLALMQLEIRPEITSTSGVVNIDYRSDGMGGKGRLYLEIGGRSLRQVLDNEALDALQVYVFVNDLGLAGVQVDAAKTLPERLAVTLRALEALEQDLSFELLDCPDVGLENTSLSKIFEAAVKRFLF